MYKIKIDAYPDLDGKKLKTLKIDDTLFEIAMRKGLIEENKDGYHFIGDYEELLAFKSAKPGKGFKLLD